MNVTTNYLRNVMHAAEFGTLDRTLIVQDRKGKRVAALVPWREHMADQDLLCELLFEVRELRRQVKPLVRRASA